VKFISKILLIGILSFSILYGGAIVDDFGAISEGDNIVLHWLSLTETNVKHYEILRGPDKDHLSFLATIEAKGSNSDYTFVDASAYKTTNSTYAYGLVIVDVDGSKSEPMRIFVDHNVSGVKRTWGSIKALFR
jgi:hypothetical protein